jgi:GrpB-like predicted nucleotidyltransferase (UPF0157 family)/RimJ/RimL family protein N-acetyltransferase
MKNVIIREPTLEDKEAFLAAMQQSQDYHHPWIKAPLTSKEFDDYLLRFQQPNQKSYLVFDENNQIVGVFNISEIVRGLFQNAFLGFYGVTEYADQGYMSAGLKLVLKKIFKELTLHRIEANIQPDNHRSLQLVKKNGFRYEGFSPRYLEINGEWRGHEHWAMTIEDYIRDEEDVIKKDHVEIIPYQKDWSLLAAEEINKLRAILPTQMILDIQHVGSTSIPGMSAKPIIDIQIAVQSLEDMKSIAITPLQKIGYEYWHENPDPERMFFVKGMPPYGEKRTHHVHIFKLNSKLWQEKILFRNYLMSHPELVKEYQLLKIKLAEQYAFDREEYTKAKEDFINEVLKRARLN